ncbi:S-adenosylmethionine synthase [uncultured archaeon]|nr:S-adenosylmethionine synthase [uncultured archaeon]
MAGESRKNFAFVSESVTEGHPDKFCDQVSDAISDYLLSQDRNSRVAVETNAKDSLVHLSGEVTSNAYCDVNKVVASVVKSIGYDVQGCGLDWESVSVISQLKGQSPEIAQGVSKLTAEEQGAGDQGMMFGYACRDTPELMPLPISLAHGLTRKLAEVRKNGKLLFLRPDGKSQVTVAYEDNKPIAIRHLTLAAQHDDEVSDKDLREGLIEEVVKSVIPSRYLESFDFKDKTKFIVNGTGRFSIGGPKGDAGVTGRKIIVDTYGGFARHGGGAFSGKDPSKVDRSGAYMARYIAKNIVAAGLAERCEVQLAYTIGIAEPDNLMVDTFGTGIISDEGLEKLVKDKFPLSPGLIIEHLKLKDPIYLPTASYGHFGREPYTKDGLEFFTWEKTDKAEELADYSGQKKLF